jgi:hypothetical protein
VRSLTLSWALGLSLQMVRSGVYAGGPSCLRCTNATWQTW